MGMTSMRGVRFYARCRIEISFGSFLLMDDSGIKALQETMMHRFQVTMVLFFALLISSIAWVLPIMSNYRKLFREIPLHYVNDGGNGELDRTLSREEMFSTLHTLLRPKTSCKVDQMSGTDLAYIGDVVYELFVRSRTVWPSKRTAQLQDAVVAMVRGTHTTMSKKNELSSYNCEWTNSHIIYSRTSGQALNKTKTELRSD
jgi:hypothetical protein